MITYSPKDFPRRYFQKRRTTSANVILSVHIHLFTKIACCDIYGANFWHCCGKPTWSIWSLSISYYQKGLSAGYYHVFKIQFFLRIMHKLVPAYNMLWVKHSRIFYDGEKTLLNVLLSFKLWKRFILGMSNIHLSGTAPKNTCLIINWN